MTDVSTKLQWLRYFASLQRKLNFAWFLQCFKPVFLFLLLLFLCVTFIQKSYYPDLYNSWPHLFEAGLVLCFLAAAPVAWWRARGRFFSLGDVVLHCDEKYHFNCSLLQAHEQTQDWPPLPDRLPASFSFQWRHNAFFMFMALMIIVSVQWIPVAAKNIDLPVQAPASWRSSERLIELLEDDETLDQEQVDKFRSRLKELQSKEADEWFSHATLEASESLLQSLQQTSEEHDQNMADVGKQLQKIQDLKEYLKKVRHEEISVSKDFEAQLERTLQRLERQWDEEMQDLMRQYLKINKDMMQDLKNFQPSDYVQNNSGSIDKEKLKQWLEQMKDRQPCQACNGEEKEDCSSCQGGMPGLGGLNRGPGSGGDPLGHEESEDITGTIEAVHNDSERNRRPGQLLGTSDIEPMPDKKKWRGDQQGGKASHTGEGSDAVWKNNLLPEEQELLRGFSQ